jgi:glycosyltransferase involved in cell wall biosynthesis
MISVIIPVYNAEQTIEDCVQSICRSADNDTDYEVIIVNDGSNDSSGLICDKMAELNDRIRVLHQMNSGVSCARNAGLDIAQGDYICFVDSDDKVTSDYLSTLSAEAPSAEIIFFGFSKVQESRQDVFIPISVETVHTARQIDDSILSLYNNGINYFGFTWSKLFRASIIRGNGLRFNPKLRIKEDEIFTLQYCQHIASLKVLDKALYEYTIFENSLSHCGSTDIDYEILANENETIGRQVFSDDLKHHLLDLSVAYKLSHVRNLIAKGCKTDTTLKYIKSSIIPLLNGGYGLKASRWIKAVCYAPPDTLKAYLIYLFSKR